MELIDTPNPNAKKIETNIDDEKALSELEDIIGVDSVFFWSWIYHNYKRSKYWVGYHNTRYC